MNDKILKKIDEIVSYLKESDDYIKYNNIREKMKGNEEITKVIESVKTLQKKIVNEDYIGNSTASLKKDLDQMLNKLNSYPIYKEFTYLNDDLNNAFQSIKNIIEKYINSKTN